MTDQFDAFGWRKATTTSEKIYEAADFFGKYRKGTPIQVATLQEAFSTPDFAFLLTPALEQQAIAAQKAAEFEFEGIVSHTTRPDFTEGKLIDLWENNAFEEVLEGEEYKSGRLSETSLTHRTAKRGKSFGLTFELQLRRVFSDLANFPKFLGNGAVRGRNLSVSTLLVDSKGAWNSALFGTPSKDPLSEASLKAALKALSLREDHRGDLVDTSDLVLLVGPGLAEEAKQLVSVSEVVTKVTNGSTVTETRRANPFTGKVTVLESRELGKRLAAPEAWALVQGKSSTLPSIIETGLEGHDGNVDIRVKRDQGQSVGGGDIPINEGSFNDDTTWFRGRDFYNHDAGFGKGVFASSGK